MDAISLLNRLDVMNYGGNLERSELYGPSCGMLAAFKMGTSAAALHFTTALA